MVKQGLQTPVYHYDLQENLIAESDAYGQILREWVYVNGQHLAMIVPAAGGGGGGGAPCGGGMGSCRYSVAGEGSPGSLGLAILILGPAFVGIGLKYHNRKLSIGGLTFIGSVVFLLVMPQAKSQTQYEQIFYYHNDHLGTPRVLTDQSGAVVWDVDYTPFGEIANYVTNTLPVDQPFRFPGQYHDSITGLYYNWNRYYMPEVGRYNKIDPFFNRRNSQKAYLFTRNNNIIKSTNNSYPYTKSNPILYQDASGKLIGYVVVGVAAATAVAVTIGILWAMKNCEQNLAPDCARKCQGQGDTYEICTDDCIRRGACKCKSIIGAWGSIFGSESYSGASTTIGEQAGQ